MSSSSNLPDRDRPLTVPHDAITPDPRVAYEPVPASRIYPEDVIAREEERFGGVKFGSAFFGWLTATGTAVLLTALVAAGGAAIGLGTEDAGAGLIGNADVVGIASSTILVLVIFLAYYCGGYVAGRMARFNGAKQGFAVWLWALLTAVIVAVVATLVGSQFDILANLNSFPRIPLAEGVVTVGGILTASLITLASLGGALLGGVAGMRYHRRVDAVGLEM